jgi:hypothetical protein
MKRRHKRLTHLEVQLRMVFTALAAASLVLCVNFWLWFSSVSGALATHAVGSATHMTIEVLRATLIRQFLICTGVSIPLAAGIGLLYSFKFAGPLCGLGRYFSQLATGRWDAPFQIRKGDDLQDLCREVNSGIDPMRQSLRKCQSLLSELHALAAQGVFLESPARERIDPLLDRAAVLATELRRRLPAAAGQEVAAVTSPGAAGAREPASLETAT